MDIRASLRLNDEDELLQYQAQFLRENEGAIPAAQVRRINRDGAPKVSSTAEAEKSKPARGKTNLMRNLPSILSSKDQCWIIIISIRKCNSKGRGITFLASYGRVVHINSGLQEI